jgi:hypothetical protein
MIFHKAYRKTNAVIGLSSFRGTRIMASGALNLSGCPKIYDSKPTVLSFCVSADVGMQILMVGCKETNSLDDL